MDGRAQRKGKYIQKCKYEIITCKKCSKRIWQCKIDKHLSSECPARQYKCVYCSRVGKYNYITRDHLNECINLPIPCPIAGCTERIRRCNLDEHKLTCPQRLVFCTFNTIGCTAKVKYCDLAAHNNENASQHLDLAVTEINIQKQQITDLKALTNLKSHDWNEIINKIMDAELNKVNDSCYAMQKLHKESNTFLNQKLDKIHTKHKIIAMIVCVIAGMIIICMIT